MWTERTNAVTPQRHTLTQAEKDALATQEISRMVDSTFPKMNKKSRGLQTIFALAYTPFHLVRAFRNGQKLAKLANLDDDGTGLCGLDLYNAAVKQLAYRAVYVTADDLGNYFHMTDDDLSGIGITDLDGLVRAVQPRDDDAIKAALGGVPPNEAVLPLVLLSALMKTVHTHRCQAGTADASTRPTKHV